jgi:hypothetical protein
MASTSRRVRALPVVFTTVGKPGGGTRRLVRLSPQDEARFRSVIGPVVARAEASLGPRVLANRAGAGSRPTLLLPWRPAHARWRRVLDAGLRGPGRGRVVVAADVRDCYGAIAPETVERIVRELGSSAHQVEVLVAFLGSLRERGVTGLPVGPEPSAILANAVLAVGDRVLDASGVRWWRWVDDVVLIAPDGRHATLALDAWRAALARVGLAAHEGKLRRWTDPGEALGALLRSPASLVTSAERGMMRAP